MSARNCTRKYWNGEPLFHWTRRWVYVKHNYAKISAIPSPHPMNSQNGIFESQHINAQRRFY